MESDRRCDVWSVAATYWSEEERDPAAYAVRVLGADRTRAEHLRAVAAVSGWNWRTARARLAADARPTVFCGTAVEARAARARLEAAGVRADVVPAATR